MAAKNQKTKTTNRKFSSRKVVKRHGHAERFDERKIYASVYEACHAAQLSTSHAEKIAASVSLNVKKRMEKKTQVNSHEIHREVVKTLKKNHEDAAYLYEHHRNIC